jgi:hypothetical protein
MKQTVLSVAFSYLLIHPALSLDQFGTHRNLIKKEQFHDVSSEQKEVMLKFGKFLKHDLREQFRQTVGSLIVRWASLMYSAPKFHESYVRLDPEFYLEKAYSRPGSYHDVVNHIEYDLAHAEESCLKAQVSDAVKSCSGLTTELSRILEALEDAHLRLERTLVNHAHDWIRVNEVGKMKFAEELQTQLVKEFIPALRRKDYRHFSIYGVEGSRKTD